MGHFIHLLAQLVLSLQKLAHADIFEWSVIHQDDFEEVKKALCTLPDINPLHRDQTFYVYPSVGTEATGVVLMQKDQEISFM